MLSEPAEPISSIVASHLQCCDPSASRPNLNRKARKKFEKRYNRLLKCMLSKRLIDHEQGFLPRKNTTRLLFRLKVESKKKMKQAGPSRRPAQVSKVPSFFNMRWTLFSSFINFSVPQNTPRDTHKTRKQFFPNSKHKKNQFLIFFRKSLIVPKQALSARKTTSS